MTGNKHKFSYWLPLMMVLAGVLVAILPMIIYRDFTPSNELRYLSIADESLADGHWWAFTNHGVPYADKPPLYLWFVMLGKWLLGSHQMWFLSLFSVIPAFVTAGVMYAWTRDMFDRRFSTAALLMLFSCGLFAGMVFTLRMDMLMTMFIVLAFYSFRRLESCEGMPPLRSRLLFALWIFLAVFSKGPMGILIPLVATTVWLFLTRRMRLWTRAWGWPTWILLLLLCAGWFGAVYAEGGTEYLDNLLVHQTVGRAVNSFHHKRPVWYYLVSLTYTLQPWAILVFGAVVYGIRRYRRTDTSLFSYFLVIVLSAFVLLSLISSKLQVYMLPAYPFMVYLTAIVCARHKDSRLVAGAVAIPAALLLIAGLALPFAEGLPAVAIVGLVSDTLWFRLAGYLLFVGGFMTLLYLYKYRLLSWAIEMLSMTVLGLVFLAGLSIPTFNADLGYGVLSQEAMRLHAEHPEAGIVTYRLDRPENIDAYLGDVPFRMVESADSIGAAPTVIMTETRYKDEVPDIKTSIPVGMKYTLILTEKK